MWWRNQHALAASNIAKLQTCGVDAMDHSFRVGCHMEAMYILYVRTTRTTWNLGCFFYLLICKGWNKTRLALKLCSLDLNIYVECRGVESILNKVISNITSQYLWFVISGIAHNSQSCKEVVALLNIYSVSPCSSSSASH